jgi:zinc transport system permease protein
VISALLIARAGYGKKVPVETSINLVWALGAATGAVFLAFAGGYSDPSAYLFGNILILSPSSLWVLAVFDLLVIALALGLFPQWASVTIDSEFARCRGINVELIRTILLVLVGVAVVLLVDLVGVVLVIAMFTLPAGLALGLTRTLKGAMLAATLIAALSVVVGLAAAYMSDFPSGASIVGVAALVYGLGSGVVRYKSSVSRRNMQ